LLGAFRGGDASAGELTDAQSEAVSAWLAQAAEARDDAGSLSLPNGLSAEQADATLESLWGVYRDSVRDDELGDLPPTLAEVAARMKNGGAGLVPRAMTLGDLTMPFVVLRKEKGEPGPDGRALLICTHGGGRNGKTGGPHAWGVNTREWRAQASLAAGLYAPDGVYVVPRMADDRLGRWWHRHNHDAFERVIEHAVAQWGVDPDRVYLLGISEGGYGTAILAPFMPDRFAGANAMAAGVDLGNPPENLRNLAFRTDVGEKDTMFNRVAFAKKFHERLDDLHEADPAGYKHAINVQANRGHGIDYRPGVAWIAEHTRDAWPSKLVWLRKTLHDRRRDRHYWIEIEDAQEAGNIRLTAEADRATNGIKITARRVAIKGDGGNPTHAKHGEHTDAGPLTAATLRVLLHDKLLDLDKPVRVTINGEVVFEGKVERDAAVQLRTLAGYGDPSMAASAQLEFDL
jgi:predicted esterase